MIETENIDGDLDQEIEIEIKDKDLKAKKKKFPLINNKRIKIINFI
jgi:hypothetical protein